MNLIKTEVTELGDDWYNLNHSDIKDLNIKICNKVKDILKKKNEPCYCICFEDYMVYLNDFLTFELKDFFKKFNTLTLYRTLIVYNDFLDNPEIKNFILKYKLKRLDYDDE